MDFDRYKDTYRDELEDSISFAGAGADFYTEVKAAQLVDVAARKLGEPKRLRVLDAGCGPGETDAFLRGAFAELSGADVSEGMVEAAAGRNPWANYRHFEAGEPLPFEDGHFDLSFAICVLHHVDPEDRGSFMSELARVTQPGGIVAIFEHNPVNPLTRWAVAHCPFDEGVDLLPVTESERYLAGAGLRRARRDYVVFFPRPLAWLRFMEASLGWCPLGAQYAVHAVAGRFPRR